ncbi:MAG: hypothetical protein JSS49_19045 [Planctomycetes bacterium]|nr:hypothetical protein [Planctomycetota bacterium]
MSRSRQQIESRARTFVTTSEPPVQATSVTTSEHPSSLPLDPEPVPLPEEAVDDMPDPFEVPDPLEVADADDIPLDDPAFDVVLDAPDDPVVFPDPEPEVLLSPLEVAGLSLDDGPELDDEPDDPEEIDSLELEDPDEPTDELLVPLDPVLLAELDIDPLEFADEKPLLLGALDDEALEIGLDELELEPGLLAELADDDPVLLDDECGDELALLIDELLPDETAELLEDGRLD